MTGTRSIFLRSIFTCALIMCITAAQPAAAQSSRIYFAGYFGLKSISDAEFKEATTGRSGDFKMDNAMSFAGALGIRLSRQLRFEGEYNYSRSDVASADISGFGNSAVGGELKSKIIFANLYYDFDVPWKIEPFIGGGLGYGWHSGEFADGSGLLVSSSSDDASVMWNVGAGFRYRTSPEMA